MVIWWWWIPWYEMLKKSPTKQIQVEWSPMKQHYSHPLWGGFRGIPLNELPNTNHLWVRESAALYICQNAPRGVAGLRNLLLEDTTFILTNQKRKDSLNSWDLPELTLFHQISVWKIQTWTILKSTLEGQLQTHNDSTTLNGWTQKSFIQMIGDNFCVCVGMCPCLRMQKS